jgi:membrane fusion protein (multidrug efflux system)
MDDKKQEGTAEPNATVNAASETKTKEDIRHRAAIAMADAAPVGEGYGNPEEIAAAKRPMYKRPAFLAVVAVILIVGAVFGIRYWLYARAHQSTDDAFIDGDVIRVSPKTSGYVAKIYVKSNQEVKEGELLLEIDPRDAQTRLDQAHAALDAGIARLKEAQTGVDLTRANSSANVQLASASVRRARTEVSAQAAAAAAEKTRINQAGASVATAQANMAQAQSQVTAAEAEAHRAEVDVTRYQTLFDKDEVSRQRLDQAIATSRTAAAQLEAARGKVAAMQAMVNEAQAAHHAAIDTARRADAQVAGTEAGVGEAQGRLLQASTGPQQVAVSQAQAETAGASIEQLRAAVAQAELELSYTKVYAPANGRVTNKAVEEGALVQVGQPLMAIVPGTVWVTANFKESQIGSLKPGQTVEVYVDAYPNQVFRARVESLQAGTGARFSLLPPENATGNYVKVVQRVPVKIVFDPVPDAQFLLAPGMSVVPEVKIK